MYLKISHNFYHQSLVNSSSYLASWKALKRFQRFYLMPNNNKELASPHIAGSQLAIIFKIIVLQLL